MAEEEQQQAQEGQDAARQEPGSQQGSGGSQQGSGQDGGQMVPSHRLREETSKRQQMEKKIQEFEERERQREEESAQAQGEYQQLAEKRKQELDKLKNERDQLQAQMVRNARYRTFNKAAAGVILPEALDDAFGMLSEQELQEIDNEDESGFGVLAQRLAERKPYLADGARGSGSGGSSSPVLGGREGPRKTSGGRKVFDFAKSGGNKRQIT